MALATHAQHDTDGDGLTDTDESTLFLTSPILADSDQDGMEDGLETQLGTSPRSSNSVFRLFQAVTLPGSQRQLCWISQTGQVYQLQNADSRTNGPSGDLVWRALSTVTATDTNTCLILGNPAGLYRVRPVVATNNDALPPLLSLIQATPPSPGGTAAALGVVARDLAGVVRVEFLDGANLLGTATRGAGDSWSFSWPLNVALNGRHHLRARAFDAAGNIGYSPVLAFDVSVGAQSCVTVGSIRICADSIVASNGTLRATGHVRAGGVTFSAETVLTITGSLISGNGSVTVPGLGTVLTGSFDINATTGWLTVRAGTTPIYSGIIFNPRVTLNPTSLLLNVFSNSICSSGSLTLQVPNHVFGPAAFTGTICFDPLAASLSAVGSMTMGSLSATGAATLLLRDSTFTLAGNARLASSNGDAYTVSNGVAQLRYALAVPTIAVSGRLGIPDDISVQVQGEIAATGAMSLTGSNGQGSMNGFRFAAATGTLTRPAGLNTVVTLQFNARLVHTNLNNYLVAGTVRSTGDIDISGTGAAAFPTNIGSVTVVASFNPLNARLRGNVFAGNVSNAISGTLLAPNYLKPVQFSGIMRADGSVDITGNSGPYTAATFGGALPAMDAPNLSFEERLFIGSYHLFSRNNQTAASVNLRFTRTSDASGGIATLTGTATVTTPGLPPLTLVGQASSTGAASLTGSIVNQNCTVWGHQVNNLSASANRQVNGVFTFNVTGGTLVYGGLAGTAAQATGSISSDGSGFIDFTYNSCTLNGYTLQNVTLRLAQAVNGTRSLSILGSGRLLVPGHAGFTVQVTGGLTNNGTFLLSGTTAASVTLSNLSVASLAANATATLTHNGLTIAGNVSGGVLLRVPVLFPAPPAPPVVPALLNFPVTGPVTISGCVTVSPIVLGQFRLESTAPDGSFSACLSTNGLNFPNAARLLYRGSPLTLPALPVFTISASGSFSINVTASMTVGASLDGHNLPSLAFTFVRSGGVTFAQNVNATLRTPGFNPGFNSSVDFNLGGTLNSDGTFNLTGNGGSSLALTGLPAGAVNASVANSVSFSNTGLKVGGTLSGGLLGQLPVRSVAGNGLLAEYFDNMDFTGPKVTRVDATVDFDWGNGQPDPGIGADTFSVRWTGWLRPEFSEAYTFYTTSDDGVRLWVNNQLLIDNWTDHGPTVDSATITLQAGQSYEVRMEFYENGAGAVARLEWSSSSRSREVVPNIRLFRSASGGGLLAEYFDNMDFTGPKVTRVDSAVDFNWGNGQPDAGIGADTFSARWTGWVQPEFSETYTFYTTSDDGVRLWVNNQLLIDNWTDHGSTENSGTVSLQAGQYYDIRLEYYENGGDAVARLEWASASRPREIIPMHRLFQESSVLTVSGALDIAASGRVTMSGCMTVSPFTFGQFRLESSQPGGNFTACFGPGGLIFPGNARLLYGGSPLTMPVLPSFTVSANGNFLINVSTGMTAGVRLRGFALPSLSFTIVGSGNALAVQNLAATVQVPGGSVGFSTDTTMSVSGSLNSDGTFNLTGNGGSSLALSGLPIGSVNASAANSVNFRNTGLTATVSCSGSVLGRVPLLTATATLTIAASGDITMSGNVTCSPLTSGVFTVERFNGGNLQATLDNFGLRFSNWQVRVSGVFNVAVSLPGFTINSDGSFAVIANGSPSGFTVAGYGFTSVSFTVERSPIGALSISGFNATMFGVTGFNQRFLNGTISNGGVVVMDLDAPVTLGGFTSSSGGHLALRNSGLTAAGNFTIAFGSVSGSFSANVAVSANGSYSGNVTTTLTIGGHSTSGSPLALTPGGLNGLRTMNMNGLQVPLPNLSITPTTINGSGSKTVDSDWQKFVDPPFTDLGDLWGRTIGTVTVNVSSSGTINLSHSLTLHWWWGRFFSDPPQMPGQTWSIDSGIGLNANGTIAFTHGVTCPCGTFFDSWSFDLWN